MPDLPPDPHQPYIDATRLWMERAVIGLNLCPFAKASHAKGLVRFVVSDAGDTRALAADLERELAALAEAAPDEVETTLLIHPFVLDDFLDYNDFLEIADGTVEAMGLEGEIQVASFHPRYQFADATPEDAANFTNRSPYPVLHLLREESVSRAVEAFPDSERIYERNVETLRRLGEHGFRAVLEGTSADR